MDLNILPIDEILLLDIESEKLLEATYDDFSYLDYFIPKKEEIKNEF